MKKTMLATAIAEAATGHIGQFDKGGMPYILHPLKVMHYLKSDDMELMAIAVLHDYVEDCYKGRHEEGYAHLLKIGMTPRIIAGVRALTKIEGQDPEVYLAGILANIDAIRVKLCDLRHNTDTRRLKSKVIDEKTKARLIKYYKMVIDLEARLAELERE